MSHRNQKSRKLMLVAGSLALISVVATRALHADPPAKETTEQEQFPLLRQKTDAHQVIAGKDVAPLMLRKLDRAKDVLEGLALEDYAKIARSAREMKLLSLEAGWKVVQTKEYMQHSNDFRRACDQIEDAAKTKDVSRAALGYVSLTVRCVECHSYLRENKIVLANHNKRRLDRGRLFDDLLGPVVPERSEKATTQTLAESSGR